MITPIILSGGSGTRLWPLSRSLHPKQFIELVNETTPFQDTILRLPEGIGNPTIVCNEEHRFLVAEQMRQININSNGIILEPIGKNTAPAIALAALNLINNGKDQLMLVLSADHIIEDNTAFHKSIKVAKSLAEDNKLVAFGVVPIKAETGYGYIEIDTGDANNYYKIKSFKEKPNKNIAQKYLDSGNYLWNSGIFMFKASVYLKNIEKFEPDIINACKKSIQVENKDLDFIRLNNNEFLKCPDKSIDYAVMEHTQDSIVVRLNSSWTDIGSWANLYNTKDKDINGNSIEGDVILDNVKDSYIYSSNRLVSALGLSNLILVDTQDALLVADKNHISNLSEIVKKLKDENRYEVENHRKVLRPWGYYDSIDNDYGFKVKRILVNPGARLSLQKHKHRAEHWVVVRGKANVTCGDKFFELIESQSTYIPKGEIHRLENQEKTDLEIIEIQTGDYLGEDDIIRLEDDYKRYPD